MSNLAQLLIIGIIVYLGFCMVWPNRTCPNCRGSGKIRSASGRSYRRCWRCQGKGGRQRLGRRFLGAFTSEKEEKRPHR